VGSAKFFLLILSPSPRPMLYLHKYQFPSYSYVIQLTYVSEVRLICTLQRWGKSVIEERISMINFVLSLPQPHPVMLFTGILI